MKEEKVVAKKDIKLGKEYYERIELIKTPYFYKLVSTIYKVTPYGKSITEKTEYIIYPPEEAEKLHSFLHGVQYLVEGDTILYFPELEYESADIYLPEDEYYKLWELLENRKIEEAVKLLKKPRH